MTTEDFNNRTGRVLFPDPYRVPALTPLPEDAPIDAVVSGDTGVPSTID